MKRIFWCKLYHLPLANTSYVQRARCRLYGFYCATCSNCLLQNSSDGLSLED